MHRIMCKSKIHRVTVTEKALSYEGSITIDPELMEAANLIVYEVVKVANLNNGARFQTYVIEGKRGSGEIVLNVAGLNEFLSVFLPLQFFPLAVFDTRWG